jgi:hypothetical protein
VTTAAGLDDETLIRAAIERFRNTYNGRLIRHNERRAEGLLTFSQCDIAIAGDDADAQCPTLATDVAGSTEVWTLHLARAAGTWTMKSMAVTAPTDRSAAER